MFCLFTATGSLRSLYVLRIDSRWAYLRRTIGQLRSRQHFKESLTLCGGDDPTAVARAGGPKAIKGRIGTGVFDISLTDEEVNGERFERLSLDLKLYTGADQYSYVALSFWDDSVMHLSIQRASTGRLGWDYNYRRFGDFTNVSSKEMAELIESTVSTFDLMPDTIEKMWFACNLTHDDGFVDVR